MQLTKTAAKIPSRSDATSVRRRTLTTLAAFAVCVAASATAHAETLLDALTAAYQYSPTLDSARAQQRARDEDIARANSGYRPDINASANAGREKTTTHISIPRAATSNSVGSPRGYAVDLVQPVFTGFQTTNAVNAAEANDRAGRETLRETEQQVLLDAVTAFGDVTRDQAIVKLNENNLKFLDAELKAQRDRFSVGEVTKTDVAQSEARRALGQSDLDQAKANLKSSRAIFEQVIGHPPTGLIEANPNTKLIPRSLDDAVGIGTKENPQVVQSLYLEQAARFSVDQIRGELLPQAQLEANYTDEFDPSDGIDRRYFGVDCWSGKRPDLRGWRRNVCACSTGEAQSHRGASANRGRARHVAVASRSGLVAVGWFQGPSRSPIRPRLSPTPPLSTASGKKSGWGSGPCSTS